MAQWPIIMVYGIALPVLVIGNVTLDTFSAKRKYHRGERFLVQRRIIHIVASYDIFIEADTPLMARRCYCQGYYHIMELDFVF